RTWCLIVPPSHNPNTNAGIPVLNIPELDLLYNTTLNRYETTFDGFTEPGVYKVIFLAKDIWGGVSLPKQSYITQSNFVERAVLVAGGSESNVQLIARHAYETLQARLFNSNTIQFLNVVTTNADVDGDATLANLADAITNWAHSASQKLDVYLIGFGTNDTLRLNGTDVLAATNLDAWLDGYQLSNRAVNVILEFNGSGGWSTNLLAPASRERIVIASTRAGHPSLMDEGGTVSFSEYFLSEIFGGKTIGQAETKARKAIRRASGLVRQRSGLDDDGDGILSEKNQDGNVANTRYLGAAFATGGEGPNIGQVIPPTVLTNETALILWAAQVTDVDGISNVWCVITPPEYDETGDLVRVDLTYNAASNRYEALYEEFTNAGSYTLTFYAEDNVGDVSPAVQSEVIRPDKYEVDDAHTLAHPYYVGTFEQHTLHTLNDEDWVWFYAQTNYVYDIETIHLSTNVDTVLDVYYLGGDGQLVKVDHVDDFGREEGELTGLNFPAEGMYFVQVSQYVTNGSGPGSYELIVDIPAGDGVLIVIAAIWPTTNALPTGSFASLDGDLKYFNGSVAVSYPYVAGGTHLLAVYSSDPNCVPVEDPNWPNQVVNPWNAAYGDPKYIQAQQVWIGQIAGSVGFSFIGKIRADGEVRDADTHARIGGTGIAFLAASGYLTNYVMNGDPFYASYKTPWQSQGDGLFPGNVWLPAQTLHVKLTASGYQDLNQNNVIVDPAPGATPNLGTKYLAP
ncbi:MAG: hypothetical protein V1929_02730, partial [bacterium]